MPWLNLTDKDWLCAQVESTRAIYTLDDHASVGGLGDRLLDALSELGLLKTRTLKKFGVTGYPACGTPPEVLKFHGLDAASLAAHVLENS